MAAARKLVFVGLTRPLRRDGCFGRGLGEGGRAVPPRPRGRGRTAEDAVQHRPQEREPDEAGEGADDQAEDEPVEGAVGQARGISGRSRADAGAAGRPRAARRRGGEQPGQAFGERAVGGRHGR